MCIKQHNPKCILNAVGRREKYAFGPETPDWNQSMTIVSSRSCESIHRLQHSAKDDALFLTAANSSCFCAVFVSAVRDGCPLCCCRCSSSIPSDCVGATTRPFSHTDEINRRRTM